MGNRDTTDNVKKINIRDFSIGLDETDTCARIFEVSVVPLFTKGIPVINYEDSVWQSLSV